jgi:16S rRNA (guanine(966)-N(2))-methyltransferase RsmD
MARTASNRVRIIGGEWRSRIIEFPNAESLRPTPDRVRETLFNWLGQDLSGKRCLDLFAGAGALGFEALSRGAKELLMVERSAMVLRALRSNAERLQAGPRLRLATADALEFLLGAQQRFDIVFLDPPYGGDLLQRVLPMLHQVLAPEAVVYAECNAPWTPGPHWRILKSSRAASVHFYLMEWAGDDEQSGVSGQL